MHWCPWQHQPWPLVALDPCRRQRRPWPSSCAAGWARTHTQRGQRYYSDDHSGGRSATTGTAPGTDHGWSCCFDACDLPTSLPLTAHRSCCDDSAEGNKYYKFKNGFVFKILNHKGSFRGMGLKECSSKVHLKEIQDRTSLVIFNSTSLSQNKKVLSLRLTSIFQFDRV